jgi:hypothetical protein
MRAVGLHEGDVDKSTLIQLVAETGDELGSDRSAADNASAWMVVAG